MSWRIVKRRLGRAGSLQERSKRQREWDQTYGEGNWEIGYVIAGDFVPQDQALDLVYYKSYEEHFEKHPADLQELVRLAKRLRNPHAEATTSVDLQVPAITAYLERHSLSLSGTELVDIGAWNGQASHAISIRLSPLHIHVAGDAKTTLEGWWQQNKCLAVWDNDSPE
jgi:hypothetical protein